MESISTVCRCRESSETRAKTILALCLVFLQPIYYSQDSFVLSFLLVTRCKHSFLRLVTECVLRMDFRAKNKCPYSFIFSRELRMNMSECKSSICGYPIGFGTTRDMTMFFTKSLTNILKCYIFKVKKQNGQTLHTHVTLHVVMSTKIASNRP
jgi:hypothetical protein